MKKYIFLILALCAIVLVACAGENEQDPETTEATRETESTPVASDATEPSSVPETLPEGEIVIGTEPTQPPTQEGTEPTDPAVEPTDPTQPTDATSPTNPANPTNPTESTDPTETTATEETTEPTEETDDGWFDGWY